MKNPTARRFAITALMLSTCLAPAIAQQPDAGTAERMQAHEERVKKILDQRRQDHTATTATSPTTTPRPITATPFRPETEQETAARLAEFRTMAAKNDLYAGVFENQLRTATDAPLNDEGRKAQWARFLDGLIDEVHAELVAEESNGRLYKESVRISGTMDYRNMPAVEVVNSFAHQGLPIIAEGIDGQARVTVYGHGLSLGVLAESIARQTGTGAWWLDDGTYLLADQATRDRYAPDSEQLVAPRVTSVAASPAKAAGTTADTATANATANRATTRVQSPSFNSPDDLRRFLKSNLRGEMLGHRQYREMMADWEARKAAPPTASPTDKPATSAAPREAAARRDARTKSSEERLRNHQVRVQAILEERRQDRQRLGSELGNGTVSHDTNKASTTDGAPVPSEGPGDAGAP